MTAVLSACGGDDDAAEVAPATEAAAVTDAASTTASAAPTPQPVTDSTIDPALADYCALARELTEMEDFPSVAQIEEYAALAPAELAEPVARVLELLRGADGDFTAVFADSAGGEALQEIVAFEGSACGLEQGGGEEGPPQDPSVTAVDPAATRIDLEGGEYHFHGDLPATPGRYSLVMTNAGEEMHLMILIRLEDGAELDDVLSSEGGSGVAEEFESVPAPPGAEAVITADLGVGRWVLLCPIPGPEGRPHFADGMIQEFEVA